jgi:hypothetical protein
MQQVKLPSQRCGVEEFQKLKKHNNLLSALLGNGMMLSGRCSGTGIRLLQLLDTEVSVETEGGT